MLRRYMEPGGQAMAIGSALLMLLLSGGSVLAQRPQWGGPNRDFEVESQAPFTEWGEAGPKLRWIVEGRVWAPPTLVGRRLYVRDRKHVYAFEL